MRLRGIESRAPSGYAEAFYARKLVLGHPCMTGLAKLLDEHDPAAAGRRMHDLCRELFPLTRSITGDGVRQTLAVVGRTLPLERHEVPSGTPVLDWTVPPEWNLHDAWVAGPDGRRVVDLADSNLHVMSYSVPVRARMPLAELQPHLHSLPDRPTWVPYRTSYYNPDWGFCLRHDVREALPEGEYEVVIDATLAGRARSPTPSASCPASWRTRSSSPPTSATRRWPTTTSRASPC